MCSIINLLLKGTDHIIGYHHVNQYSVDLGKSLSFFFGLILAADGLSVGEFLVHMLDISLRNTVLVSKFFLISGDLQSKLNMALSLVIDQSADGEKHEKSSSDES